MTEIPVDYPIRVDQFLTYKIARLHNRLNAQAARLLRDICGLSLPQWRVLALVAAEGEVTATHIVSHMGVDKGLLSRTLKALLDKGLVNSTVSQSDLRVHLHDLTEKGQALYDQVLPHMASRQHLIMSSMTAEERAAFESMLDRLELLAETETLES